MTFCSTPPTATSRHTCTVRRGRQGAKYWLLPLVRLARNVRFRQHELTEIEKIILEHREFLLEAWNDFFGR